MNDNMPYVIVRTSNSGVFAGYLDSREGREVKLKNARRLLFWAGSIALSQLDMELVSKPEKCKLPNEIDSILLLEATEIIYATERDRLNIAQVPDWEA